MVCSGIVVGEKDTKKKGVSYHPEPSVNTEERNKRNIEEPKGT